ncbi:MAG: FAD-binding oxidoreductase [Bdellovibrionales bacterium]
MSLNVPEEVREEKIVNEKGRHIRGPKKTKPYSNPVFLDTIPKARRIKMPLESLKSLVDTNAFFTSEDYLEKYGRDWTRFFEVKPSAVVFPKSTKEVQSIVLWANENNFKIVPSGGRTGLSGGAVASNGEIVLSLEKMNQILDYDPIDRVVEVEAGLITEELQNYAKEKGQYFPVDFAARGSSQIGGNIATNAGGIKVIKYGNFRDWVVGLEVVTGEGEILELNNGLIKNNTGYDFRHLFIGSEGTLGIITKASMKLSSQPPEEMVLLLGLQNLKDIMPVFENFTQKLPVTAFEMFTDKALKYVKKASSLSSPLSDDFPVYLVVEVAAENESIEEKLMEVFEYCMEEAWIHDGVISQNETQAMEFWSYRELVAEAVAFAPPHKNDISVRISKIPDFIEKIEKVYSEKYPDFEVVWFGHIGDGNLHINILKPDNMEMDKFLKEVHLVDRVLFEEIQELKGSVSAEHGVGLVKKEALQFSRTKIEIEYMKRIKKSFDPNLVLNPGKIFD